MLVAPSKPTSIDELPDDDWEARFTKAIVRNLARLRAYAGMTIDEFATACDEVAGEPGRFKANTLQGLFAGKRKTIALSELVIFAEALRVPLIALLVPVVEPEAIEWTPRRRTVPIGIWDLVTGFIGAGSEEPNEMSEVVQHFFDLIKFQRDARKQAMNGAFTLAYNSDPNTSFKLVGSVEVVLERFRGSARQYQSWTSELEKIGIAEQSDDEIAAWLKYVDPETVTIEGISAFVRKFEGQDSGGQA
jgi:hypothetical protein